MKNSLIRSSSLSDLQRHHEAMTTKWSVKTSTNISTKDYCLDDVHLATGMTQNSEPCKPSPPTPPLASADSVTIDTAHSSDAEDIARIGAQSFPLGFHGTVARVHLDAYTSETYTPHAVRQQLADPTRTTFVARQHKGFSKVNEDLSGESSSCNSSSYEESSKTNDDADKESTSRIRGFVQLVRDQSIPSELEEEQRQQHEVGITQDDEDATADGVKWASLQRLYLEPEVRGGGIGGKLMAAEHNGPAQKLYIRRGYTKIGDAGFVVGRSIQHEWVMEKNLQKQ
ncbi:hypothetical protein BX600DRAFT_545726 [Xylariales sp. PMI_506]|nr:hypothetical protein BX600DRAFT_545726 [Xylariales sp. PMI_506]